MYFRIKGIIFLRKYELIKRRNVCGTSFKTNNQIWTDALSANPQVYEKKALKRSVHYKISVDPALILFYTAGFFSIHR
ncbi:hypothetical protein AAV35_012055 [Salimicrobium jeotgali]|uniref:Uncharacterized protein n=1 Tax=Salimicrobium jeotgali TaxID=1230341 RepID=A0AAC8PT29_9BACI|nr:hypothetical protein AAV35_012055 [Salimicrobium jeotgali]